MIKSHHCYSKLWWWKCISQDYSSLDSNLCKSFFFLYWPIPLSCFSWLPWLTLWICWISWTFSKNLLSIFLEPSLRTFGSQSTSWLHFPPRFSYQYTVDHLFLLFPCGIFSILQETVDGLLASNRSAYSVLFGFTTSYVDMLSVYGFWGHFLLWGSFWIRVVFSLFIHLGIFVSSNYLLSSRASFS